ncbi:MAG: DNA repair protein RecN [Nocardioidaceae bacterium]|nr:DNA repair protein RecN [Nocardioidaceae bacterium]
MWQEIRLSSLGVIAEAELELGPGLTVITGETGAGKTMVVTALALLRGGRADAGLVRHGDARSRVEARVGVDDVPGVAQLVEDAAGELDDGAVILGRTVSREGRSRAYVGGATVPAGVLGRISDELVAVHGQSDQHRLLKPAAQRAALDAFAGDEVVPLLGLYRPAHARWTEVTRTHAELVTQARERAQELDRLTFGLEEVAAVDPQPGEDADLRAEEDRLAHGEGLALAADGAHGLLSGDDATGDAGVDVTTMLAQAQGQLDAVRQHDPDLDALAARLGEAGFLVADVATELASYARSVDVDPSRLASVQDRRAALAGLQRKYGPGLEEVLEWARTAAGRVGELQGDDDTIAALEAERDELFARLVDLAGQLTRARRRGAASLSTRVSDELDALAMPHARVEVSVEAPEVPVADDLGPDGADRVELLLAANAGSDARSLARSASGGELSRVMLALEVVVADRTSVPTFVFDEVDAGIGGKAAVEVGRRLARLARHAQVIAVTHLPQVAAFADRHYLVVKSDDGTVTTSGVASLDDGGRVAELSRMLAGLEGSATAEAHAAELLEMASTDRAGAT